MQKNLNKWSLVFRIKTVIITKHVQNKVVDMINMMSCKDVTVKNVKKILATRLY
jgi:hypothetical protein